MSQISSDDLADMVTLMWCCTASACNADKTGFPLSLDDFADALEPETVTAFFMDIVEEGDKKRTAGEPEGIELLLGYALGCVGMSLEDFERCTPSEFTQVAEIWSRRTEAEEHARWERTRMLAAVVLQPYSRRRLKPEDVMVFPWDKGNGERSEPAPPSTRERAMEMLRRCEGSAAGAVPAGGVAGMKKEISKDTYPDGAGNEQHEHNGVHPEQLT